MKICIGYGTDGEILEDYKTAKACNFCTNFCGFGLHWFSGRCEKKNKDLGYDDYNKEAKVCDNFECLPELLR